MDVVEPQRQLPINYQVIDGEYPKMSQTKNLVLLNYCINLRDLSYVLKKLCMVCPVPTIQSRLGHWTFIILWYFLHTLKPPKIWISMYFFYGQYPA